MSTHFAVHKALKEWIDEIESTPPYPLQHPSPETFSPTSAVESDYVSYMKGVLRAACLRLQQFVVDDKPIISTYRGSVALQGTEAESLDTKRLRVAVFNPGRTGFLTLCTQEVMMWRLLIITQFLEQETD